MRAALAERLPAYMVPAAVVVLDALPLTPNGKLDTRALPAPEYQDVDRYRAPASAVEEILAGIYAQVLGLERVGVDDSFFDLGGDSLSAMRVIAAINTGLDAGLAVRTLFDAPTVAQLAPRIGGDGGRLEPLVAAERPAVVPLSFAQSRLWFLDQLQGPSPVYNMAVALRLSGRLDVEALGAALADVVGRHESLRTLFAAPEGIPQQLVMPAERADFGWQVVDATGWPADRLGEAIGAAARHSLTWPPRSRCGHGFSASPMTNMCWWRWCTISPPTAGRSPRWCVIWGWPMPAGVRGRPRAGRRCRCSMSITRCGSARSWVIWPTATARSPRSWPTGSRPWPGCPSGWRCPPIGPIRRSPITAAPVWRWTGRRELQQRVREVAREHNATSFMVMQAALAVLLSKVSASSDVAVGFPIAGRGDPALDELVGFFVNTLVLRVDLAGDPTVAELLAQVRAAQPGRLRAPRRALRGARRAAQPDPIPDPSPAGPGDVGLAEPSRAYQRPRRRAGVG